MFILGATGAVLGAIDILGDIDILGASGVVDDIFGVAIDMFGMLIVGDAGGLGVMNGDDEVVGVAIDFLNGSTKDVFSDCKNGFVVIYL